MSSIDVDELVKEAQSLREKLSATVVKLNAFTELLQLNVSRLKELAHDKIESGEKQDGSNE